MLSKNALYFCRVDKFEDRFEGSLPAGNQKDWAFGTGSAEPTIIHRLRPTTIMNCWHANEYESAAMWKLYLSHGQGVAIRSTFRRLTACFKQSRAYPGDSYKNNATGIFVGEVNYIDYDKESMPDGNAFWPFVHKRRSFEHEREIRAIACNFHGLIGSDPYPAGGDHIPVDLRELVEAIYVPPVEDLQFVDLIKDLLNRYGLGVEVRRSELGKTPIY